VVEAGHTHGAFQALVRGSEVYVPLRGGIFYSADEGETFAHVYETGNSFVDSVIGTDRYLYSNAYYEPDLKRASIEAKDDWSDYTTLPSGMQVGPAPMGAAAVFDGVHWVIVTANDGAGIWRYVEP
jgi:hypothetical protein